MRNETSVVDLDAERRARTAAKLARVRLGWWAIVGLVAWGLLFLSLAAGATTQPDLQLTPGATFPVLDVATVCRPGYTTKVRQVTAKTRREVAARYHVAYRPELYEFDHLIPLSAGGSNDVLNLWPQPIQEALVKDVLERRTYRQLCVGKLTLPGAQMLFRLWARDPARTLPWLTP